MNLLPAIGLINLKWFEDPHPWGVELDTFLQAVWYFLHSLPRQISKRSIRNKTLFEVHIAYAKWETELRKQLHFKAGLVNLFLCFFKTTLSLFSKSVAGCKQCLKLFIYRADCVLQCLFLVQKNKPQWQKHEREELGLSTPMCTFWKYNSGLHLCPISLGNKKSTVFSVLYNSVKGSSEIFLYTFVGSFFDTWRLFPV